MHNTTLERKNFVLYLLGTLMSNFGSAIYSFAIGLYILEKTNSGTSFALTLAFSILPVIILSPFAGVLADRFEKKKIVVNMDILNGILFIGLFALMSFVSLEIWMIYLTTFLSNLFVTFFGITFTAAMPQLVSKEKLPGLNSASHIINASSSILAPVLGGIVFALIDIRIFILANGISFLISAISESFIDFKFNSTQKVVSPETVTMKSVGKSLKEGFVYLRNNGSLMKLLWIFIVFNISFSFGVMVPIPYILNNYYMVGATAYGIVNGFAPAGVVLGAAIIGFFMKKISFKSLLFVLTIAMSILMLMISLPLLLPLLESSNLIIVIFFAFLRFSFGLLMSMVDVPIITYIQSETEEQYRGRVFSIILALVKVSTPVALMISGFLTDYMNPMILPLIAGVFALISFLFLQRDAVKAIFSREKCFEAE